MANDTAEHWPAYLQHRPREGDLRILDFARDYIDPYNYIKINSSQQPAVCVVAKIVPDRFYYSTQQRASCNFACSAMVLQMAR
jgi:hypothetical protein